MSLQALDKGGSSLEIGIIIGIASLTLTIFAPIFGYFVSTIIFKIESRSPIESYLLYSIPSMFNINFFINIASQAWNQVFNDHRADHCRRNIYCYGVCLYMYVE